MNQGSMNFSQMTSAMFKALEMPFIMAAALFDGVACGSGSSIAHHQTSAAGEAKASARHWPTGRDHRSRRSRQRARARARRRAEKTPTAGFQRIA